MPSLTTLAAASAPSAGAPRPAGHGHGHGHRVLPPPAAAAGTTAFDRSKFAELPLMARLMPTAAGAAAGGAGGDGDGDVAHMGGASPAEPAFPHAQSHLSLSRPPSGGDAGPQPLPLSLQRGQSAPLLGVVSAAVPVGGASPRFLHVQQQVRHRSSRPLSSPYLAPICAQQQGCGTAPRIVGVGPRHS